MAGYFDRSALTAQQRKGLTFFGAHPEASGLKSSYATGAEYAVAILQDLGDKGWEALQAAKKARRMALLADATDTTTKADIEATIAAEFTNGDS